MSTDPSPFRTRRLAALTALALLAAACGGGGASGGGDGGGSIEEIRPVTVTGNPLPRLPDAGEDPAVGMEMPEMEGASFDGTPVSITDDGRPKVLLILAHW